jgi:hypothetical protein
MSESILVAGWARTRCALAVSGLENCDLQFGEKLIEFLALL